MSSRTVPWIVPPVTLTWPGTWLVHALSPSAAAKIRITLFMIMGLIICFSRN